MKGKDSMTPSLWARIKAIAPTEHMVHLSKGLRTIPHPIKALRELGQTIVVVALGRGETRVRPENEGRHVGYGVLRGGNAIVRNKAMRKQFKRARRDANRSLIEQANYQLSSRPLAA